MQIFNSSTAALFWPQISIKHKVKHIQNNQRFNLNTFKYDKKDRKKNERKLSNELHGSEQNYVFAAFYVYSFVHFTYSVLDRWVVQPISIVIQTSHLPYRKKTNYHQRPHLRKYHVPLFVKLVPVYRCHVKLKTYDGL